MDGNSNLKDYLPIGSVIKCKDNNKYIILGRFIKNEGKMFDYMCVKHPYGLLLGEKMNFFNDEDVLNCIFLGNINYRGD